MSESAEKSTGRLGARIRRALGSRIVWLTDERRDAAGDVSTAFALAAVLGREHYTERRKQYPILSRRDLDAVLEQELAGAPPTLTTISAERDDRREVTFFEIRPEVLSRAAPALFVVPESLALAATLPAGGIATVDRRGFRYFLAANGVSQPAGGAVTSAELFAMAAGLDAGAAIAIDGDGLHERILSGLGHLPPGAWLRLRTPSLEARVDIEWQPIALMAGIGLVAYLALASGYLTFTRQARERELSGLGNEVEKLLVAQRDVDRMLAEQSALAAVTADRRSTYRIWQVVSVAWSKGAVITAVQLQDTTLTLRGSANVATDVLAAVDAIPGFADAQFSSPVRQSSAGREEFSLELTMQPEADRG
jgi:hypothetical protein